MQPEQEQQPGDISSDQQEFELLPDIPRAPTQLADEAIERLIADEIAAANKGSKH